MSDHSFLPSLEVVIQSNDAMLELKEMDSELINENGHINLERLSQKYLEF
jgi:hypothetical protein